MQKLITDPVGLGDACPLAPVMPVNSASIIARMTRVEPAGKPIGAVLRPCEIRALVELVKLKQADITNVVIIGLDCFGTYDVSAYTDAAGEGDVTGQCLSRAGSGDDSRLRRACSVCVEPIPRNTDVTIGLLGADRDRELFLLGETEAGARIVKELGLPDGFDMQKREAAVNDFVKAQQERRDSFLSCAADEVKGLDRMLDVLAPCVSCHNCRIACPICYCRECLLDSPTFIEWEASKYLDQAQKKGGLRMPADSLLFHLVRMNHMSASCVSCGLCEQACPHGIEVFKLFCLTGSRVQQELVYRPGADLDEPLPLTVFREDELHDVEK
jgi:formate dehydrogenase subunit beta